MRPRSRGYVARAVALSPRPFPSAVAHTLLAFPLGMAGLGVWIGLASGLAIVSALLIARWIRRDRLHLTLPPWARNPA